MYPVPAQQAGEELERIYGKRGTLEAADVVDESRPEEATLHPCFEWRDPVAAELWREHQARGIINCIITVKKTKSGEDAPTRAFFHTVTDGYDPVDVVLKTPDKLEALKQSAFRDLEAFRAKYETISELAPIFEAVERVKRKARASKEARPSASA